MTGEEARALDAADPLGFARQRFGLPDGLIYLDGNSLGALPAATATKLAGRVERQWGEDLIASWNRHGWIDAPSRVAGKLSPLLGAAAHELLIADSTSVCLFKLLAAAVQARPGRPVILSEQGNFPTDLYVAQGLAQLVPELRLVTVGAGEIAGAIDERTAVVMLTQVDYRSGARHDMAADREQVTVGLVQAAVSDDLDANLESHLRRIEDAAARGAQIVCQASCCWSYTPRGSETCVPMAVG